MLDKKDISNMESYMKEEDSQREILINRSRIILKNSKSAIYSIHRNEISKAKSYIDDARKIIAELEKIAVKYPHLGQHIDNALEEFAEASLFYGFVHDKLPTSKELGLDPITYLAGLSDFTGELGRRAVLMAIEKNSKEVSRIRDLIDEVYGLFSMLDLRNGELRKKADAIKWNLNKVEELLYDLKSRR